MKEEEAVNRLSFASCLFLPDVDERKVQELIQPPGQEFPVPGSVFMAGVEPVFPGFSTAFSFQDRDITPVPAFFFQ